MKIETTTTAHANPRAEKNLSPNHAVGSGERTRLACCRRRLAVGFVSTIYSHCLVRQNGKTKFAARCRKPHAGGVFPISNCIVPARTVGSSVCPAWQPSQSPALCPPFSDFGFLSDFGLRPSDLPKPAPNPHTPLVINVFHLIQPGKSSNLSPVFCSFLQFFACTPGRVPRHSPRSAEHPLGKQRKPSKNAQIEDRWDIHTFTSGFRTSFSKQENSISTSE